jgi:hypothetical protein
MNDVYRHTGAVHHNDTDGNGWNYSDNSLGEQLMPQQLTGKQAFIAAINYVEALAIGGAVVATLWDWHLVHWLCWSLGAGAAWGFFYLIAHPQAHWLAVLGGVGISGTVGYFFGLLVYSGSHFFGWVFAAIGAVLSLSAKEHFRAEIRRMTGSN